MAVHPGGSKACPSPDQGLEGRAQGVGVASLIAGDGGCLHSGEWRPFLIGSIGSPGGRGGAFPCNGCFGHSHGSSYSAAPPGAGLAASGFFSAQLDKAQVNYSTSSKGVTGFVATCNDPGAADQGLIGVKASPGSSVPPTIAGTSSPSPPVDSAALAAAQSSCPNCQRTGSSSALRVSEVTKQGSPILVYSSSGVFRPLIPAAFCRPIFDAVHSLAHPGIRVMRRLIASCFVWPCLAYQVAAWCRDCQQYQRATVTSQPAAPPSHIANPVQQFSHIHIDLVRPLPVLVDGHTHLFTIVDRSTPWAEAIPLCWTSSASCATALVSGWVGVPTEGGNFAPQSGMP